MPEPSWCRACGRDAGPRATVCAACGVELGVAGRGDPRVGRVVDLRGAGVAVASDGATVTVLGRSSTPIAMPVAEFDRLGEIPLGGPPVLGEAGRIWASGDPRADAYADRAATASMSARRAAAVDAIALVRLSWLPTAGLTESELLWYQARDACRTGAAEPMLSFLEALPPDGYPARVTLLLIQAAALLDDPHLAGRAVRILAPFDSADARELRRALGGAGRALEAYLAGMGGLGLDESVALLGDLPLPLLDDLIDGGALTRIAPGCAIFPPAVRAYLRCRAQPGTATPEELAETGFTAERARRLYLARDAGGLAGLGDDPDVRHYRALLEYVRDRGRDHLDDLRAPARALVELIEAGGDVPVELAADPSSWPLLRAAALAGTLRLDDVVRAGYPDFGVWFDLCELTRLVYAGDFAEAIRQGRLVRRRAPDGPLATEVTNLIAYATWQCGRAGDALAELLSGGDTLLLNAAVVAAGIGSLAALEPLGRLCRRAADPRLRHAALLRAVSLWLADEDVPDYPPVLAGLIRHALGAPIGDDGVYHLLIKVSSTNDAPWLGAAAVHFDNPAQADLMRYFQTRARMVDQDRPEELDDLARVLVTLWGRDPRPEWVVCERDWMATMLSNLVRRPFGEAAGLRSVIETLLDGDTLELPERLILAARAGGHLAMSLVAGEELSRADERRLLFDPVHMFLRHRAELPARDADRIGAELGRCVAVAAVVVTRTLLATADKLGELYNEISFRREWDHEHTAALRAEQTGLLDRMAEAVTRLRTYLPVLDRLPVPEDLAGVPRAVRDEADSLAAQVAGLRARSA